MRRFGSLAESPIQFQQKKDNGEIQIKAGIVILSRSDIDRINRQPTVKNLLSYERDEQDGTKKNKYHGNILIKKNTSKPDLSPVLVPLVKLESGC